MTTFTTDSAQFSKYIARYLNQLPTGEDPLTILETQLGEVLDLFSKLPVEKHLYKYAPEKWTFKEVLGHIIDTERIMAYRALCISRGEKQTLPSFDENAYVVEANFNARSMKSLLNEYQFLRQSNIELFRSFDDKTLDKVGIANHNQLDVKTIISLLAGHERHHLNILKERY